MTKLCRFTDLHETTIYVNPLSVRYVRPKADKGTTIYFDEDHRIAVSEELEAVVSSLGTGSDGES